MQDIRRGAEHISNNQGVRITEGRDSIEIGVYGMENIPDEFLDEEERDAKRRKDETGRPEASAQ